MDLMMDEHGTDAVVTLYFGADVPEEEAAKLASNLESKYDEAEFIVQQGDQPLYYYYVSVE